MPRNVALVSRPYNPSHHRTPEKIPHLFSSSRIPTNKFPPFFSPQSTLFPSVSLFLPLCRIYAAVIRASADLKILHGLRILRSINFTTANFTGANFSWCKPFSFPTSTREYLTSAEIIKPEYGIRKPETAADKPDVGPRNSHLFTMGNDPLAHPHHAPPAAANPVPADLQPPRNSVSSKSPAPALAYPQQYAHLTAPTAKTANPAKTALLARLLTTGHGDLQPHAGPGDLQSSSPHSDLQPSSHPILHQPSAQRDALSVDPHPVKHAALSLTSGSETPLRCPSVSFRDDGLLERSRRFTISAQPSSANLASLRQGSATALPTRKGSVNDGHGQGLVRTGSVLGFLVAPSSASVAVSLAAADSRALYETTSCITPSPPVSRPASALRLASPGACSVLLGSTPVPVDSSLPVPESAPVPIRIASLLRRNSVKKSNKTVVGSPVGPPVPFQEFLSKEDDMKFHILLACTGSVATIKVPLIIDKLFQIFGTGKISVQLVVTQCAGHFLRGLKIHNDVKIWRDGDEWANFSEWSDHATTTASTAELVKKHKNIFEKVALHNELRKWADIMLIAPLSANTLAKIANGILDNLLTSIVRSWGPTVSGSSGQIKKPILVAPAMNTLMYTHPLTAKHLKVLSSAEEGFGMEVLKPVEKVLMCGDIGMGGMREWLELVEILRRKIKLVLCDRKAAKNVLDEREEDEHNIIDENDDDDDNDDYDDEDDDDDNEDDDDDDDEDDDEDDDDDDDDEVDDAINGDFGHFNENKHGERTSDAKGTLAFSLTNSPIEPHVSHRTMSPLNVDVQSII